MAQFARPDSDIAAGGWTATPLWSKVDEGATGDGVEITSDNNTSPDDADLGGSNVSDPGSSAGHILRAKWHKDASGGHAINAVLELWQGTPGTGTLVATLSVTGIGDVAQTDTYTLSAAEADSITDYSALNFRLSRQGDSGGPPGNRRSLVVDFVELETPDASGGSTFPIALAATGTGVASLSSTVTVLETLTATATGVASLARKQFVSLVGTAVGTSALVRKQFISLTATAVGVASLAHKRFITLTATATGIATLASQAVVGVSLTASAIGQAALELAQVVGISLAATATGVASIALNFIEAIISTSAIIIRNVWRSVTRAVTRSFTEN